jgi:hypothetical protein
MSSNAKIEQPALNPVVEKAMVDVTRFVYRKRNLTGPQWMRFRKVDLKDSSSRAAVIHALMHLKYHNYLYNPQGLGDWTSSHGWKAEDVAELISYAVGVLGGQRYHTAPDPFGFQAIDRWRAGAAVEE